MNSGTAKPVVAVAGATGFIGGALLKMLTARYSVIGLTRSPVDEIQDSKFPDKTSLSWRQCDLFSLLDAEKALEGVDYAFYLVHSMMPSARLAQGNFQDMDLILADNFARAAAKAGVKQIIYLGGLISGTNELSKHLRSRLEVEETLSSYGVPVTALRAGLIIGANGSTFRILVRLVTRFPVILFSKWFLTLTHPIALSDVIEILMYCLGNEETYNQSFDIGGPSVMNYRDMILRTAEVLGYKRHIFIIPVFSAWISSLLLSLFTSSPVALVAPLLESLKNPMVAKDRRLQEQMGLPGLPFAAAVNIAVGEEKAQQSAVPAGRVKKKKKINARDVRSVQRLPLPSGRDADWVARRYSIWLPRFFNNIVKVEVDESGNCYFYFRFMRRSLLELTFSEDRSFKGRPLYYITGGLLARLNHQKRGRLEFREVLQGKYVLVAIHDYIPTLPWFIYDLTQALLHLWVMRKFGQYLSSRFEES